MAADSIAVELPKDFYDILDNIKDAVVDESADRAAAYKENILNAPQETVKITPTFDSNGDKLWEQVGFSFMKGAVKIFFDELYKFNQKLDYLKPAKLPSTASSSSKKETENKGSTGTKKSSFLDEVLLAVLSGGALALVRLMAKGSSKLLDNIISTIASSIKKIPFLQPTWWSNHALAFGTKLGKIITKPFVAFVESFEGFFGENVVKTVRNISKSVGKGLGSLLMKAQAATVGKVLTKLKYIPFLNVIFSLFSAYQAFSSGRYKDGIVDLVCAFPILGPVASIGLAVFDELQDSNIGGAGVGKAAGMAAIKGAAKAASKAGLTGLLGKALTVLLKPLGFALKKIPVIGTIIGFGFAIKNFIDGDYLKGILNIVSGIASIFPGIGTAIAVGVDLLNYFLNDTDTGSSVKEWVSDTASSVGSAIGSFFSWIWDGIKSLASGLLDLIVHPQKIVMKLITSVLDFDFGGAIKNLTKFIVDPITNVFNWIKNFDITGLLKDVGEAIFVKPVVFLADCLGDTASGLASFFGFGSNEAKEKEIVEKQKKEVEKLSQKTSNLTDVIDAGIEKKTKAIDEVVKGITPTLSEPSKETEEKIKALESATKNISNAMVDNAAQTLSQNVDEVVKGIAPMLSEPNQETEEKLKVLESLSQDFGSVVNDMIDGATQVLSKVYSIINPLTNEMAEQVAMVEELRDMWYSGSVTELKKEQKEIKSSTVTLDNNTARSVITLQNLTMKIGSETNQLLRELINVVSASNNGNTFINSTNVLAAPSSQKSGMTKHMMGDARYSQLPRR
jgi:uncharacterized UPF0160 family protein